MSEKFNIQIRLHVFVDFLRKISIGFCIIFVIFIQSHTLVHAEIDVGKLNELLDQMENVEPPKIQPVTEKKQPQKIEPAQSDLSLSSASTLADTKSETASEKVIPVKNTVSGEKKAATTIKKTTANKNNNKTNTKVIPDTRIKTGPEETLYLVLVSALLSFIVIYYNRKKIFNA